MNHLPKFRIRERKNNIFIITILSGKYHKVSYSYINVDIQKNIVTYQLDFLKHPEYNDDLELREITKQILDHIIHTYVKSLH